MRSETKLRQFLIIFLPASVHVRVNGYPLVCCTLLDNKILSIQSVQLCVCLKLDLGFEGGV